MNDPNLRFIDLGKTRLAYRESGQPDKPPVVLLHGLGMTSAVFWRSLINRFERDYRIVAFDLPGHGDSDPPRGGYEAQQQAKELSSAMELLGITRARIIGHSLGGILATHIALFSPQSVERLVLANVLVPGKLLDNIGIFVRRFPPRVLLTYGLLMLPGIGVVADRLPRHDAVRQMLLDLRVLYDTKLLTDELVREVERNLPGVIGADIRDAVLRPDIQDKLPNIDIPTLLINADADLFVPIESGVHFSRLLSNAKLVILKQAGHYSLLDRPEEFNSALTEFLTPTARR